MKPERTSFGGSNGDMMHGHQFWASPRADRQPQQLVRHCRGCRSLEAERQLSRHVERRRIWSLILVSMIQANHKTSVQIQLDERTIMNTSVNSISTSLCIVAQPSQIRVNGRSNKMPVTDVDQSGSMSPFLSRTRSLLRIACPSMSLRM